MAIFGMNMLMLYTEDTYEIEGYPFFGYQRGRYTNEELREIDDYAFDLGIEVIPCIQTFGHLGKFLRYKQHSNIAENDRVLLTCTCHNSATYGIWHSVIILVCIMIIGETLIIAQIPSSDGILTHQSAAENAPLT